MAVITISRELGSEGTYIATEAARALGYHVADKDTMERIMRQFGLNQFIEDIDGALPSFWMYFDEELQQATDMLTQTIQGLAHHGNIVILGRGGYAALQGLCDVLNVHIRAERGVRVARLMAQQDLSQSEAEARVAENDRTRIRFIERAHKVRPDDAGVFDLVIDTTKMEPASAAALVAEAVQALGPRAAAGEPSARDFEVSKTLAALICNTLGCDEVSHQ